MLVSRAKERELRAGMAEMIYLVPELCRMTGLTGISSISYFHIHKKIFLYQFSLFEERERSNMQMMRALDTHTRLGPEGRQARLLNFSRRMNSNPKIVQDLKNWEMDLPTRLVEFGGRILPPETIVQGSRCEIK